MFEIGREELTNFINTTKKLIEKKPQMNESNTRLKVIVPLLELLGWDINFDVETEYSIQIGSTVAKVDYALSIDGQPTVLIEAKGFDSNIQENFARQAISYGRVEEIKWAALTNGKSIHIYDTTRGKGPKECLIEKIDIDEFIEKKSTLCLLSKESIKNKETDSIVDRIRKMQDYMNIIIENKDEYSNKISRILKEPADKELYKRIDDISEEILENVIKQLQKTPKDIPGNIKPRIEKKSSKIPTISRDKLVGNPNELVAIYPSKVNGIEFLKKYNAWGYVKMNRPAKYLALYIARPHSEVLFFAEIDHISKRYNSKEEISNIDDADKSTFKPGKQIIYLKQKTLVQFEDPIPVGPKGSAPFSLQYSTIEKIKSAKNTKEL